jgi:hypothetical protein
VRLRYALALTRHKISCREPDATRHAPRTGTANTLSVNRRLARGQLHRLVRWFVPCKSGLPLGSVDVEREQKAEAKIPTSAGKRRSNAKAAGPCGRRGEHDSCRTREELAARREANPTMRLVNAARCGCDSRRKQTWRVPPRPPQVPQPTPRGPVAAALRRSPSASNETKISCREPSVHATHHTLTTAATGSVNRRLARGQLHRLVRWLASHRRETCRGTLSRPTALRRCKRPTEQDPESHRASTSRLAVAVIGRSGAAGV